MEQLLFLEILISPLLMDTKFASSATGTYYLLRAADGSLNIQAEVDTCNTDKACISKVAVQFNGALAIFKNNAVTLTNAAGKITTSTDSHGAHSITLSDGLSLRIQPLSNSVDLSVPAVYYKRVNGLFGNFDGSSSNDLTNPSGSTVSLAGFITAWEVTNASQNLFTTPNATIPPLDPDFSCTPGTNTGGNCQNARINSVSHSSNGDTVICFALKTQPKNTVCSASTFTSPSTCPTC